MEGFKNKYRDFSKTGRLGTVSQALCYLFAQDVLGYPLVIDFDGFVESQGGDASKLSRMKRPDFSLARPGDTKVSMIESSGSMGGRMKALLRKGLRQTGNAPACFKASGVSCSIESNFAFGVILREVGDQSGTEIGYCDPPEEPDGGRVDLIAAARRSYAAWFAYGGHFGFAQRLLDGDIELRNSIEITPFRGRNLIEPSSYWEEFPYWWRSSAIAALPGLWLKSLLDEQVFNALFANDRVQWDLAISSFEDFYRDSFVTDLIQGRRGSRAEVFRDGTVLLHEEL